MNIMEIRRVSFSSSIHFKFSPNAIFFQLSTIKLKLPVICNDSSKRPCNASKVLSTKSQKIPADNNDLEHDLRFLAHTNTRLLSSDLEY